MKKSFILALALGLGLSQTAFAQTVFSCTTETGKVATLKKEGGNYVYTFGKPNKTEITVKNPAKQVLSNLLTGKTIHPHATNTVVTLTQGKNAYILRHYFSGAEYPEEAYVYVFKGHQKLASITCRDVKTNYPQEILNQTADEDMLFEIM